MYVYVTKSTELIFLCRKFKKYVNFILLIIFILMIFLIAN